MSKYGLLVNCILFSHSVTSICSNNFSTTIFGRSDSNLASFYRCLCTCTVVMHGEAVCLICNLNPQHKSINASLCQNMKWALNHFINWIKTGPCGPSHSCTPWTNKSCWTVITQPWQVQRGCWSGLLLPQYMKWLYASILTTTIILDYHFTMIFMYNAKEHSNSKRHVNHNLISSLVK